MSNEIVVPSWSEKLLLAVLWLLILAAVAQFALK